MAVSVETIFHIWNDDGYGYEVGPDADTGLALEIRYHEDGFATPIRQRMSFQKEDAIALANALIKLAGEMK